MHAIKCNLLKNKVRAARAKKSAVLHLHVQQPDGSNARLDFSRDVCASVLQRHVPFDLVWLHCCNE